MMGDMPQTVETVQALLDALRIERDEQYARHLAPVDAAIAAATLALKGATAAQVAGGPVTKQVVANLAAAAYDRGRGGQHTAPGRTLVAIYNAFATAAGMGAGWGCHNADDTDAVLIPQIWTEAITDGDEDLDDYVSGLLALARLIPWRDANGTPQRLARFRANLPIDRADITCDLDTNVWTVTRSMHGVLATGTAREVLAVLVEAAQDDPRAIAYND